MSLHRINLRGPWTLKLDEANVEAARSFHSPTGIETANEGRPASTASPRVFLHWQTPRSQEITAVRLNGRVFGLADIVAETSGDPKAVTASRCLEVTAILRRFNELHLVWSDSPVSLSLDAGRYTPHPQHPLHHDTWLEIHE